MYIKRQHNYSFTRQAATQQHSFAVYSSKRYHYFTKYKVPSGRCLGEWRKSEIIFYKFLHTWLEVVAASTHH